MGRETSNILMMALSWLLEGWELKEYCSDGIYWQLTCFLDWLDSRGFPRFPEISQVHWTGIISQYTLIKQSTFMDNILIKQSWHCWSYPFIIMFILIYLCLPEVARSQGGCQSGPRPRILPTSEKLGIFVNLCTLPTHHTSNPVIYTPLVSPT